MTLSRNLLVATFWLRRPPRCRESGCTGDVAWVAVTVLRVAGQPVAIDEAHMRVTGLCTAHVPPTWKRGGFIAADDPELVFAMPLGAPQTCTLRIGGELCGKPETHIAFYAHGSDPAQIPSWRLGPACDDCTAAMKIADGRVVLVHPPAVLSLDELVKQAAFVKKEEST